jgi:hypothetical protein
MIKTRIYHYGKLLLGTIPQQEVPVAKASQGRLSLLPRPCPGKCIEIIFSVYGATMDVILSLRVSQVGKRTYQVVHCNLAL